MHILETGLFIVGFVLLIVGYRKSDRNLLAAAALLFFVGGVLGDVVTGFLAGFGG